MEKLQANVRKKEAAVRTVETEIATDSKYKDKAERAAAEQILDIAKMKHKAAMLELKIEEEADLTNPHLLDWKDELHTTQQEIQEKLSAVYKGQKG